MARELFSLRQLEDELLNMVRDWASDSHLGLSISMRDIVARGFSDIFASQLDSSGTPWPEHAPSTVAQYGPHPLLRLSNTMYQSLTTSSGGSHYEVLSDDGIEWGTTVAYAFAQNYGWQYIPAREFCYWSDKMIKETMQEVDRYIDYKYLGPLTRG